MIKYMEISKRINSLKTSPVRKLLSYANEVEKYKKIYYLNIGQPDIETPKEFFDSIYNYRVKVLGYSNSAGEEELRNSISKYYLNMGIDYEKEDVLITNGGSEALLFSLITICDVDDEILIPEPYYANYNSFFDMLQIKVNPITTFANEGFRLPSIEEIEKKITKKTKGILICNPCNPTGVVYNEEEILRIISLAEKYNLYIISDEVYREFVYGNNKAISFGSFKKSINRTIIIDSISKRYSVCGARIGAIISKNKEFMKNIYKLCQARLAVSTLDMIGAAALYKVDKHYLDNIKEKYECRRNVLISHLREINGVSISEPQGAFYIIAKLPVKNSEKFIIWMLTEFEVNGETLLITPAEGFYTTQGMGIDEVRISYSINEDDLIKAINILRLALEKYNDLNNNS